jgi:hypothetical protein
MKHPFNPDLNTVSISTKGSGAKTFTYDLAQTPIGIGILLIESVEQARDSRIVVTRNSGELLVYLGRVPFKRPPGQMLRPR